MKTLLATTQMANKGNITRPSPTATSDDDTTAPTPRIPSSRTNSPSQPYNQPYQVGRNPCFKTGILTLATAPANASVTCLRHVTDGDHAAEDADDKHEARDGRDTAETSAHGNRIGGQRDLLRVGATRCTSAGRQVMRTLRSLVGRSSPWGYQRPRTKGTSLARSPAAVPALPWGADERITWTP